MGIRSLYGYVCNNAHSPELLSSYDVKNKQLIIDGYTVSYHLYKQSQQLQNKVSGDYQNFANHATAFLETLIFNGVDILVIINGGFESRNKEQHCEALKKRILQDVEAKDSELKSGIYYSFFIKAIFINVLKKLKIKFVICSFESDETIATVSKILNIPVLSAHSDFFLFGVETLPFKRFYVDVTERKITCFIFRAKNLERFKFPVFNDRFLPLLSILLSEIYFDQDSVAKFLKIKDLVKGDAIYYQLLLAGFAWLSSQVSLQMAAEKICALMVSTGKPRNVSEELIKQKINSFTAMATYMLPHFHDLSSFSISKVMISSKKDKFFEFKFSHSDLSSNGNKNTGTKDEEFEKTVPKWLLEDYYSGNVNGIITNMIKDKTYITWYKPEKFSKPSVYEMSIPLISLTYALVSSCVNAKKMQPLELITRKDCDIYRQKINVMKLPFDLESVRNFKEVSTSFTNQPTAVDIINKVLGIEVEKPLRALPNRWRLLLATTVFWIKQVDSKTRENYLDALLLSIVLLCIIKKNPTDFTDNPTINSVIQKINDREQEGAKKVANSVIQSNHYATIPLDDQHDIIHVYSQLQCCLEQSMTINTLLNFPYQQIVIEDVINMPLMINIYLMLSRHSPHNFLSEKRTDVQPVRFIFRFIKRKMSELMY